MNTNVLRPSNSQRPPIVEQILSDQQRLRELRRLRQIRYRKKKDEYGRSLKEHTRDLQTEIDKLERRRRSVSSTVPTKESVWSTVAEFFRLFRYGLRATNEQRSAHQDFLQNAMAPDVVFNVGRGPEAFIRSWTCLSLWFQDVELELEGLKKAGRTSLVASSTTSVTITERTLLNVFPHLSLVGDQEIVERLLNQRLVVRGSMQFEWDVAYCRVMSVMTQADLLTPMLRLLGSLEATSYVFEKSLISPDFQWRLTTGR